MRIKAVLRDQEILQMELGSRERILAVANKNIDRVVNLPTLLKIMGLNFDDRCKMLGVLKDSKFEIWLLNDADQHLVFMGQKKEDFDGYQWQ